MDDSDFLDGFIDVNKKSYSKVIPNGVTIANSVVYLGQSIAKRYRENNSKSIHILFQYNHKKNAIRLVKASTSPHAFVFAPVKKDGEGCHYTCPLPSELKRMRILRGEYLPHPKLTDVFVLQDAPQPKTLEEKFYTELRYAA